jgi:hypothetical protein
MHPTSTAAQVIPFEPVVSLSKPKAMVIGDVARWRAQGMNVAPVDGLEFIAIDGLCAATLSRIAPETILSPLIADTFDAYEVAQLLSAYGYKGRYCAISDPLPDCNAVISEVTEHAPDVWFDIFVVPI